MFFIVLALSLWNVGLAAQSIWQSVSAADIVFEYRITADGENLECKLTGETTGWVAVGFNPTSVMRNANIIIGYVNIGGAMLRDDWGNSNTSHVADTSLGGSSDVLIVDANETAGQTMLHFIIPLNSGDTYDQPLSAGQSYPIILARGANGADNFTGMHADADFATINLLAPVSNEDNALIGSPVLSISGIYPNPFNPQTTVSFHAPKHEEVLVQIFNQRGQLIHTAKQQASRTENKYVWKADNVASGKYQVVLSSKGITASKMVTLIK